MLNATLIQYSAQIAVFAFVYCIILTERGMILEGFSAFLNKKFNPKREYLKKLYPDKWQEMYDLPFFKKMLGVKYQIRDFDWLYKIIIGCERCVAGQVALWFYVVVFEYDFIQHISFIVTTILLTETIKILWQKNHY